jgi:hypothetical protein
LECYKLSPTTIVTTRILIVDDDQGIRKLLGHRLRADGFTPIFGAGSWDAGVDAFFRKPFDYADLVSAIGEALGHPA